MEGEQEGEVFVDFSSPTPWANLPSKVALFEGISSKKEWIKDMRSHNIAVIRNCENSEFCVLYNQRLKMVVMIGCRDCKLSVLDSAVITSMTCRLIDCQDCVFIFEDVDVRSIECYGVQNSKVVLIDSPPLTELYRVHWRANCSNNEMAKATLLGYRLLFGIPYEITSSMKVPDVAGGIPSAQCVTYIDESGTLQYVLSYPDTDANVSSVVKREVEKIRPFLSAHQILQEIHEIERTNFPYTENDLNNAYDQERNEYEEPFEIVRQKVREIIKVIKEAKHVVCYTGAGVSTSANIPDFRGPTGVWTQKDRGVSGGGAHDRPSITQIKPTYCHYALTQLVKLGHIKFLISSNVDGLHLRSGLPKHLIIEHHGNIYKEVCEKCREVIYRQHEVEHVGNHYTGNKCGWCGGLLKDSHVGFGETLNGEDHDLSLLHARKSDVSFILGTSMNVQPSVAYQLQAVKNGGKLVLVNLQKTPYEADVTHRVYARTDVFMQIFMEELGVTEFDTQTDCVVNWVPARTLGRESVIQKIGRYLW